MGSPLIIVSLSATTSEESQVQKFAEWMGIETGNIVLDSSAGLLGQLEHELIAGCNWAMTANTLAAIYRALPDPEPLGSMIEEKCATLLVVGWNEASGHDSALSWLTKGQANRVSSSIEPSETDVVFHFPVAGRAWSRQFAGLNFSVSRRGPRPTFELGAEASETTAILLASDKPAFLHIGGPGCCQMFLSSGPGTLDIGQSLSRDKGIEENYDQLIPFLIFVRASFGDFSWHGVQNTSRLIIDDPLLADTYGCLNYNRLFDSMQRHKFGTTIAFIPWNYRRTSRRWAESFLEKQVNLSICIHGCDHTNREFGSQDTETLTYQAGVSVSRMERHQERTRLPYERVMVFPQGYFSKAAIHALRRNKYLAAVNTSCYPIDDASGELKIGDFLRPAITRFDGFPIFQRHYPRKMIDFAFDLFLGKPAFIVEHHPYLGDGCLKLESFVAELQKIEPDLTWPTLSAQIERACLVRRREDSSYAVKFFTGKFVLRNDQATRTHFVLEKDEPGESVIESVLVDGKAMPFSFRESSIQFEVELDAGQVAQLEIVDKPRASLPIKRLGVRYSFGVFVRRELSEFRDNTLSKHPGMLKRAKKIADRLRVTGDHKRVKS
jgi:hypothetical protein